MISSQTHVEHESETLRKAQELLKVWATWMNQTSGATLGFPSAAPYAGERIDQAHTGYVNNPDAEKVERAMCILKAINYQSYIAVACWYLSEMDRHEAADVCRCSKASYDTRKRNGEWFVVGFINNP